MIGLGVGRSEFVAVNISRHGSRHRLSKHRLEGTYSCNVGWSAVLSWWTILYAISEYEAILKGSSESLQPAGLVVSLVQAPRSRFLLDQPLLHVFGAVNPTIADKSRNE